jgi:hypothetical protein
MRFSFIFNVFSMLVLDALVFSFLMYLSSVYVAIGLECVYGAIGVQRVRIGCVVNLCVIRSVAMHLI